MTVKANLSRNDAVEVEPLDPKRLIFDRTGRSGSRSSRSTFHCLRVIVIRTAMVVFCGGSAALPASAATAGHRSWEIYGGDAAGTKYSALEQIDRTNVAQLKPAWIYRCDDMSQTPASTIQCNPIIVDGVAYLTSP